jgi:ATP-dependent DNA ligase
MYEPKWDGFRCLVFRDDENVFLQSRTGKSLTSGFPEIVAAFRALSPKRFVLDLPLYQDKAVTPTSLKDIFTPIWSEPY